MGDGVKVEELQKKRNALISHYRRLQAKVRQSTKTGSGQKYTTQSGLHTTKSTPRCIASIPHE